MKAGKLDKRIDIFNQILVSDGCGGYIETFSFLGSCFAGIAGFFEAGNDERFVDRKITAIKTYKVTVRHNIGMTIKDSDIIRYGDLILRINGQTNKEEGNYTISLNCTQIAFDQVVLVETGLFNQEGEEMFSQEGFGAYNQLGVA